MKWRCIGANFGLALGLALLAVGQTHAGNLEPSGTPGPTMKTLNEIPGSWSRILSTGTCTCPGLCTSDRFECALGVGAVLDRETGLVWQDNPQPGSFSWEEAVHACYQLAFIGGPGGWRAPGVSELLTLFNSVSGVWSLPVPDPFSEIAGQEYWTATTVPGDSTRAYAVKVGGALLKKLKTDMGASNGMWCVRGPGGGMRTE